MNKIRHTLRQHRDHPDEKKLLLLLDGELNSREARAIGIHLQRCRECRAKTQTLLEGLNALAEYTRAAFLPGVGAPPKGWNEFPALLDRIATAGECPSRTKAS